MKAIEDATAEALWLVEQLDALGALVDVVLPDGVHLYCSTHCRHGDHALCDATTLNNGPRRPAQCKGCGASAHTTRSRRKRAGVAQKVRDPGTDLPFRLDGSPAVTETTT